MANEQYTPPNMSRSEEIVQATIDGTEYNKPPQSRLETLLIELKEAVEAGSGESSDYATALSLTIDSSTYVITARLLNKDGDTLGTAQTVNLPLESVVVSGYYNSYTQTIILTLQSGSTIEFSVADLVSGLQSEITSTNKLNADLVDDSTSTNKFVTSAEKTAWNNKSDFSGNYNDLTNKPNIPSTLADLADDSTHRLVTDTEKTTWNAKSDFSGSYNDLTDKPTIPSSAADVNALPASTLYAGASTAGGAATSANKINTDAGSATQPVYFDNGVPVVTTYSLAKSVPADAVFTDTTYESKVAASGGTDVSLCTTGEKSIWNNKSDFSGSYDDLTNKPTIPTSLSQLSGDTTHRTVTDSEKSTWNAKADISDIPTVPIKGIEKNNTAIVPDASGVVNITVPTTAADVSALPDTTKYATALSLTINSSTFVMTGQLKDQNGDTLGTAQTIDLPLESVVVDGSYNSQTQKVVLTLQNGNTIDFSVADLVSGLQTNLSESNKLNPAYINYDSTHRAVSDTEKSTWNSKQSALSNTQLAAVNSGIDSTKVAQIATNASDISSLQTQMGDVNTALTNINTALGGVI